MNERSAPTLDQSWTYRDGPAGGAALPGLLLLFSGWDAKLIPIRVGEHKLLLGRESSDALGIYDPRMSRRHSEVSFGKSGWRIRDLGSRNGTVVDGQRIKGTIATRTSRVLRVGDTLFGLLSDMRPFEGAVVERIEGAVVGPALRRCWDEIARSAPNGRFLYLEGESGSGKELAARHFQRASGRGDGPFVAVNCASIPPNLAERLLFGVKRGTYSGADANTDGYLQAADRGTLFLDEIGELDISVQAKLLRSLECNEVIPLGATRPVKVDVKICSATHRDLKQAVGSGQFRADLFFRLARPTVHIPPVRDRLEEIPWLITAELEKHGSCQAHVSFIEACLLRHWPGNARELLGAVAEAARRAQAAGRDRVEAADLAAEAGTLMQPPSAKLTDEEIAKELEAQKGNVLGSAKRLGVHRNRIRRWIAKNPEEWQEILAGAREEKESADG